VRTWIMASGYLVTGAFGLWCLAAPAPARAQDGLPQELRQKFQELDRDGDGKVSKQELGNDVAFARGDVDKDGSLSPIEGYRLHLIQTGKGLGSTQRLVDGFHKADADKSGWLSLEEFPTGGGDFAAMDRDKDGKLTLAEGVRYQVALEMAEFILDEDLDGDGKLSPSELPKTTQPFIPLADLDADGKLNEKELYGMVVEFRLAILEAKAERTGKGKPAQPKAKQSDPQGSQEPKGAQSFKGGKDVVSRLQAALGKLDANKDGKLQSDEVVLSKTLLQSLDRDGDAALDAAELRLAAGRRDRLVTRARGIGKRLTDAGLKAKLVAIQPELEGLLAAGRIREAELLVDEVELRLLRAQQR
jgi:Ca2+-binding EF-hand superfamily protein